MPGRSKHDRDSDGLSLRESLFASLFIIHRNGAEAASKAGYKGDVATRACTLLKTPRVQRVIERDRQRLLAKLEVSKEKVLSQLAACAFADIRNLFCPDGSLKNPSELDSNTAAAISSIEVRHGTTTIRFNSKINALDLLGRFLRLWDGSGNTSGDRLKELVEAFKAGPVQRKDEPPTIQ
jgi:phage terminase small subunit